MTLIEAVILGIIEGLTEFLPISSTAHLLLAGKLLAVPDGAFLSTFSIFIQVGAIAAVVLLFGRELLTSERLWRQVLVAFIPTAIIGFLLYPLVKSIFLVEAWVSISALLIGGIFLIWFEKKVSPRLNLTAEINYRQALWVGVAQALAVVPGVSRAGATIIGGMLAGVNRVNIVKFSFLLAVPTMLSAAGYDLIKNYQSLSFGNLELLLIGFITSFFVAVIVIKWLLQYVARHDLSPFGWYRIAIAIVLAIILL